VRKIIKMTFIFHASFALEKTFYKYFHDVNDVIISLTFILIPTCTFVRISRAFYSLTPIQSECVLFKSFH
jgi:hypothetical protein